MKLRNLYLLLLFFFAGCAQIPDRVVNDNNSWALQEIQLEQLTHWSISGKLGIFTPDDRHSVDFYWQQSGPDFHIRLSALLGWKSFDIQKRGLQTIIIDSDGKEHISNDTEQLITQLTGMILPIDQLQQWVKGNPSGAQYTLNQQQQITNIKGGNTHTGYWSIDYQDYRQVNEVTLPHKMQLTRGDVRLKFAISRWELATTPLSILEDTNVKI